ncbi:MAG: hypothetical protein ACRD3O_11595, partial [Terriglobia bacterium]
MSDNVQLEGAPSGRSSRRGFLRGAAAFAVSGSALARARSTPRATRSGAILAYVGTYSAHEGAEGAPGRGEGIYLLEMNPATGALSRREVIAN